MRIGIFNPSKNTFSPFFYYWIEEFAKEKKHSFIIIGKSRNKNIKNCSFIKIPFSLTLWFAKSKNIKQFFFENKIDACFVPENFRTNIEGLLLMYVTTNGLIFKNTKALQEIQSHHHIIITPWNFLNTSTVFSKNVITIHPKLSTLKENNTAKNLWKPPIAAGQPFLLSYAKTANLDDIIFLLKAFSIFKKKLKNQIKLILLWKHIIPTSIKNKIDQYKYKDQIIIIEHDNAKDIFTHLVKKAHAYIYPFVEETNIVKEQLFALAHGIPVIAIRNHFSQEIIGNAGITVSRDDVGGLADALKMVYLDEAFHESLSKNALEQEKSFSIEYNINKLKATIEEKEKNYKTYYFKQI